MRKRIILVLVVGFLIFRCGDYGFAQSKEEIKIAKLENKLEKILGTNTSWKPMVFKDLQLNMPCATVQKYFGRLTCDPSKKYSFPKVSGKLLGTVKEFKFVFNYGRLKSATVIFGARILDQKKFYTALMRVAQRKWGNLTPDMLTKKYKYWYNADHDRVSLTYYNSNYQLEVSMPKRDTGEIRAGAMSDKEITTALAKLLGSSKYWMVPALSKFSRGMSCNQVKRTYHTLTGCNPNKKYSRGTVTIKNHPLIHALFFSFSNGKLRSAKLIFHRQLPKERTKTLSVIAFEKKWGKVKLSDRQKDHIFIYKREFGFVRRSWMIDHWEISIDFPK